MVSVAAAPAVSDFARDVPAYWDDACRHLAKRDRVMKKLIPQFGDARLQSNGDAFTTLARSIVGQQVSTKSAQGVWRKLVAAVDGPDVELLQPVAVLELAPEGLRSAGLSARKVEYLRDLAHNFSNGAVHVGQWHGMDDEAIIEELVAIRGIGRWTAEMFLMFRLHRPDVLPVGDLGIVRAMQRAYRLRKAPTAERMARIGEAWRPYRSVACWYLWASLQNKPLSD